MQNGVSHFVTTPKLATYETARQKTQFQARSGKCFVPSERQISENVQSIGNIHTKILLKTTFISVLISTSIRNTATHIGKDHGENVGERTMGQKKNSRTIRNTQFLFHIQDDIDTMCTDLRITLFSYLGISNNLYTKRLKLARFHLRIGTSGKYLIFE